MFDVSFFNLFMKPLKLVSDPIVHSYIRTAAITIIKCKIMYSFKILV